jgi:hypothetical protein
LLRGVRHLLYGEGYTIRGVQRILREEGLSFVQNVWRAGAAQPADEAEEDLAESADALAGEDEDETEADGEDEGDAAAEDDEAEESEEAKPEKAANRAREPSVSPGPAPASAGRSEERREPNLMPPPAAIAPARAAIAGQNRPAAVDSQSRQKLQTALDELIACRNLIQAALAETPAPGERTDEA